MAKISAFKGWRYNTDNISNIEDVIVPPYDVITPEEQEGYYNKSCLLYTSPSPRDRQKSRMPSSA